MTFYCIFKLFLRCGIFLFFDFYFINIYWNKFLMKLLDLSFRSILIHKASLWNIYGSSPVFDEICVAHHSSFLCCVVFCLSSPVSWVSNVASVFGLFILDWPFDFSNLYLRTPITQLIFNVIIINGSANLDVKLIPETWQR